MPEQRPHRAAGARTRVTIRDVARAAGVSVGTASTALTGNRSNVVLSKVTRERVLRVARELRYRPHAAARAMAGRRFRTVGVLATEYCMTGSYYGQVFRGIAAQAEDSGYQLMLKVVHSELEMHGASIFSEQQLDGVVIPAESEARTRAALEHYDIPHVWLNAMLEERVNCVQPDELGGMELAIAHLHALGHRRIAYMPHNVVDRNRATMLRERGYVEAMLRRGLAPVPTYDEFRDIAEHVDYYLGLAPRPTAIAVYSDAMAILTVNRLLERGVRVPQDMSVVGNEGVVLHQFALRKLTTVCAPVIELGRTAVRMLVEQIESGEAVPSVLLPETLEINESTAAPPPDAPP